MSFWAAAPKGLMTYGKKKIKVLIFREVVSIFRLRHLRFEVSGGLNYITWLGLRFIRKVIWTFLHMLA